MKTKLTVIGALFVLLVGLPDSHAQTAPPVLVPDELLGAIYAHLKMGGTNAAGQELAREIADAVTAPQREAATEAAIRKKIEDEAKAKKSPE